jgi:hypothetical protein
LTRTLQALFLEFPKCSVAESVLACLQANYWLVIAAAASFEVITVRPLARDYLS